MQKYLNNNQSLKYLKEPSARVPKDEKKEDSIIRSVFEEANKKLNKCLYSYEINKPHIAFDPGNNKLAGVSEIKGEKGLKVFKMSTDQYYHETKVKVSNRLIKNRTDNWLNKKGKLVVPSHKCASTKSLLEYILFFTKNENGIHLIDEWLQFNMNECKQRKWSFKRYVYKQKFFDHLYNIVKEYKTW